MLELAIETIMFCAWLAGLAFFKMCEALWLLFKEVDRMSKVERINEKIIGRKVGL